MFNLASGLVAGRTNITDHVASRLRGLARGRDGDAVVEHLGSRAHIPVPPVVEEFTPLSARQFAVSDATGGRLPRNGIDVPDDSGSRAEDAEDMLAVGEERGRSAHG
jgi:hypothetical protein